jgi:hypothetical protein
MFGLANIPLKLQRFHLASRFPATTVATDTFLEIATRILAWGQNCAKYQAALIEMECKMNVVRTMDRLLGSI